MVATSLAELVELLRTEGCLNVVGKNSKSAFRLVPESERPRTLEVAFEGVVEFDAEDQVVVAMANTSIEALQQELKSKGQVLPIPFIREMFPLASGFPNTLAGAISMNLPHGLQAQCGSWRDWILGMTVVLADGTVAKTGSKAVKNVAGYDVQKLFVGARGSLGVIAQVTLRTWPLGAVPEHRLEYRSDWEGGPVWIQRTLASEFGEALAKAKGRLIMIDWSSSTLWCELEPEAVGLQFMNDWFVREGYVCGDMIDPPDQTIRLMKRAKQIFDPTNKLNPGEWGFM